MQATGIILGGSAIERRRYYVTPSLIGRAHTQNDPWAILRYTGCVILDYVVTRHGHMHIYNQSQHPLKA